VDDAGEVHAAAAGRVAGDAAACAGVCQLSLEARGKANLAALLQHHLLDPADVASLLVGLCKLNALDP
jgi:hypothetical protein